MIYLDIIWHIIVISCYIHQMIYMWSLYTYDSFFREKNRQRFPLVLRPLILWPAPLPPPPLAARSAACGRGGEKQSDRKVDSQDVHQSIIEIPNFDPYTCICIYIYIYHRCWAFSLSTMYCCGQLSSFNSDCSELPMLWRYLTCGAAGCGIFNGLVGENLGIST